MGYNSVADIIGQLTLTLTLTLTPHHADIRLAVVASQSREITRNSDKIWPYVYIYSSRLSKVIDLGVNRKPMYNFLLVINSNFGRICYRFRHIDAQS